jgi:hypothetical protein
LPLSREYHTQEIKEVDASTNTPTRDWPLWWFARLEAAIKHNDRRAAKKALRNLQRLGIEVRFTLPPERREVARA